MQWFPKNKSERDQGMEENQLHSSERYGMKCIVHNAIKQTPITILPQTYKDVL